MTEQEREWAIDGVVYRWHGERIDNRDAVEALVLGVPEPLYEADPQRGVWCWRPACCFENALFSAPSEFERQHRFRDPPYLNCWGYLPHSRVLSYRGGPDHPQWDYEIDLERDTLLAWLTHVASKGIMSDAMIRDLVRWVTILATHLPTEPGASVDFAGLEAGLPR